MTIRLRPHHLLCMLTYAGKGYTPAFVANYTAIINRLNSGESIELVAEPDDICQPMLDEPACHCHNDSVRERDRQTARDIGEKLAGGQLANGPLSLNGKDVSRLRGWFADGSIRAACQGCEWYDLCSEIAQNEFRGCRLRPPLRKTSS
jgi:hypothetical protein